MQFFKIAICARRPSQVTSSSQLPGVQTALGLQTHDSADENFSIYKLVSDLSRNMAFRIRLKSSTCNFSSHICIPSVIPPIMCLVKQLAGSEDIVHSLVSGSFPNSAGHDRRNVKRKETPYLTCDSLFIQHSSQSATSE